MSGPEALMIAARETVAIRERALDPRAPLTTDERAVMSLLTSRGHYRETSDDLLWARWDAVRAVEATREGVAALYSAFADTGLHDDDASDRSDCLADDVRLVLEICAPDFVPSGEQTRMSTQPIARKNAADEYAMHVRCPSCGAAPEQPCRKRTPNPIDGRHYPVPHVHMPRFDAANAARENKERAAGVIPHD